MFYVKFVDDWFEPRTSGVGSDRSTNWDTTTAQYIDLFVYLFTSICSRAGLGLVYVKYSSQPLTFVKLFKFNIFENKWMMMGETKA